MKRSKVKLARAAVLCLAATAVAPLAGQHMVSAAGGSFNCYTQAITTRSSSAPTVWHTHTVNGVSYAAYISGIWDVAWANHSGTWNATPNGSKVCRAGS